MHRNQRGSPCKRTLLLLLLLPDFNQTWDMSTDVVRTAQYEIEWKAHCPVLQVLPAGRRTCGYNKLIWACDVAYSGLTYRRFGGTWYSYCCEEECSTFLRIFINHIPDYTASRLRRQDTLHSPCSEYLRSHLNLSYFLWSSHPWQTAVNMKRPLRRCMGGMDVYFHSFLAFVHRVSWLWFLIAYGKYLIRISTPSPMWLRYSQRPWMNHSLRNGWNWDIIFLLRSSYRRRWIPKTKQNI
jgi:hypothetical protein